MMITELTAMLTAFHMWLRSKSPVASGAHGGGIVGGTGGDGGQPPDENSAPPDANSAGAMLIARSSWQILE